MRARQIWLRAVAGGVGLALLWAGDTIAQDEPAKPAATAPAAVASARSAPAAILAQVDSAFFSAYELAVRESLASGPPALLMLGDRIVLYRGGNRSDLPLLPPLFNELKTVSHVALGLFAMLTLSDGKPLDAAHIDELGRFRRQIVAAQAAIAAVDLTAAQRNRQEQILAAALALADRTLADGRIASADLDAFTSQLETPILENVTEGVAAYLDEINRRVTELLPQIPVAERGSMVVLVTGVHDARIDNAAMQYFERLLGNPPVIAQQVMYAENVRDEDGALHLLGIHLLARRVGDAFFNDVNYMNSDLFGRTAKQLVPKMALPSLASDAQPAAAPR